MNEPLTDSLIVSHYSAKRDRKLVIELKRKNDHWQTEVKALENALKAAQRSNELTKQAAELSEEKQVLTKKEIRRMKWRNVGKWFKDQWQGLTVAGGAFGIGLGVGYSLR